MLQALLQHASSAPDTKQSELLQKCLKAVLSVCNGQVSTAFGKSSDIETALNEYTSPGDENHFYGPFIRATNIALACLGEIKVEGMGAPVPAVDIVCQQNDMSIHQTHQTAKSIWKPDLVILPLNSACASFEKKQKRENKDDEKGDKKCNAHMDTNPTAKPENLLWKDVLAYIEFKRKMSGITKVQSPFSSYKVEDYVPTKPEYLLVDHIKPVRPAPGPSQTPEAQPASDTALTVLSSGLTAAQSSHSSKCEAADTLKSAAKKSKMNLDDTNADLDVTVQTALYAAQMFAANLANYLLNIIVVDNVMWIWYYDRQGTIQSSGINFIEDLPRFMVLLYALQRFRPEDQGRNKDFFPVQAERKQCHEFQTTDEELGQVDLPLLHTSHDQRVTHCGLQGRATNVVPVTSKALAKKYTNIQDGMVANISCGEADRTSEPKILYKVVVIARVYATVKDRVSELLWHHTFTNPTSAIREVLGVPGPTTGSRILHIFIFRKLQTITKLQEKEFFDACFQCILCHATLWKEGVYHRNVSPGNMMWYKMDGKLMGVLNDCHLSSLATDPGPRSNERVGTVPFIAFDLLTEEGQRGEVEHVYRHELESFVWCFTWVSLRYKDRVLPAESCFFDEWAALCDVACGVKKRGHFKAPARPHVDPPLSPTLEELRGEMSNSINTGTTALEKAINNHFVESVLMRKQRAIRQVQEEPDLDVHDIVTMIQVFQSDVRVADIYLNLTQHENLRKAYLAQCIKKSRG
ncbi:hypothetical protein BDR04DRAFT_523485 [Suillus decipiens]|nr:hypothetical protein BDR04DRAFT_523485 [Suillus decipiens]